MNNLPFGTAVYRQFETTFLASVIVVMRYPSVQDAALHKEQWGRFTQALFSVDPLEGIFEKPIIISRRDNKIRYVFENNRVQVHISGDGYQNFADSVIPHAYKLKQFVTEVADVRVLTQLGIRKIDVFQIETDNAMAVKEEDVRRHFFSNMYCSHCEGCVELDGEESKIPGMKKQQWIEGANRLTLRSAFVKDKTVDNRYRLILDIDEQYTPDSGVNFGDLDEVLKEMNTDLYNAFMWCVSENVISIMNKGKE